MNEMRDKENIAVIVGPDGRKYLSADDQTEATKTYLRLVQMMNWQNPTHREVLSGMGAIASMLIARGMPEDATHPANITTAEVNVEVPDHIPSDWLD